MEKDMKLCVNCKWSVLARDYNVLLCTHPEVNKHDAAFLAGEHGGLLCRNAREGRWFVACGLDGKLFEEEVDDTNSN